MRPPLERARITRLGGRLVPTFASSAWEGGGFQKNRIALTGRAVAAPEGDAALSLDAVLAHEGRREEPQLRLRESLGRLRAYSAALLTSNGILTGSAARSAAGMRRHCPSKAAPVSIDSD